MKRDFYSSRDSHARIEKGFAGPGGVVFRALLADLSVFIVQSHPRKKDTLSNDGPENSPAETVSLGMYFYAARDSRRK